MPRILHIIPNEQANQTVIVKYDGHFGIRVY